MLDRVPHVVARHVDRQADLVLGKLLDAGLHRAIVAIESPAAAQPTTFDGSTVLTAGGASRSRACRLRRRSILVRARAWRNWDTRRV